MIEVSGLQKKFGGQLVLNGIDLTISPGETVAVIGPSGSGKSTLLRCLNLLEFFDTGTVTVNGFAASADRCGSKEAYQLRQQTAMVFQNYNLFNNKTALANVAYAPLSRKMWSKNDAEAQAMELLDRVGLRGQAAQYPVTLSGGQKQRVSIARALAVQPQAILFDEPTSSLDPELVQEVLQIILQLAREKTTMLIVTHEIEFARQVADRVIFLDRGTIISQGPTDSVLSYSSHTRVQQFLRQEAQDFENASRV